MFYFCRNLTDVTVSFSCGIVYSRRKRTPESEKKQMSVYLIKRKIKKKMLVYVPGTYISPFVVALERGVNSNPSRRERLFLRTTNPGQDPNSCVHGSHEACYRTQETRPGAWSSSVQTNARARANHILPKPSTNFRTGQWAALTLLLFLAIRQQC